MESTNDPFGHTDQRYARILALAADAIICIDDLQRIVLFNNGAEVTFGFAAAEVLGHSIEILIPERFRNGHARHISSFSAGPPAARHMGDRQAIFAVRKSGEEFPAEATISKIALDKGHVLTVVLRDISERFHAEERRRLDAEKLRQALVAGKLGGFEQGFATNRMVLFGDAPSILGIGKTECHRDEVMSLIHEDDRGLVMEATQHIAETGRFDQEYRIRKPDGTVAWIKGIGVIVSDSKQHPHLFGTVQDITQQKEIKHELERRVADRTEALQSEISHREETQKQLVHAQRMEAFGQLTGGIAHDFNNLLTVIGGNLELLQDQVTGERPERQLKRALEAVGMGSRLTQRLLTFARRRDLEPEVLNLNDQVITMIDLLRRTIGETITISSVLSPDLGRVKADASEIENAILNLALNARDAMPAGGKLVIETANAVVDADFVTAIQGDQISSGNYVRLSVADTGSGMTPDVLAMAFEPFFTTKEHGRGTGLGLATIYGFARQSGGYAAIDSEIGLGTTVNIYLPRTDQPLVETTDTLNRTSVAGEKRILVVEDNPDVRDVTIQRLEKLGYQILSCDSGPAAVEQLKTNPQFDLVFSDIMMAGGMSGYDLAEWVSKNLPLTKVLLTSGFSEEFLKRNAHGSNALKVLRKPYANGDLANALHDIFGEGQ
ncbi:MAG: PAS domain S-box protein [Beijerinckiaceae bacterium]